MQGSCQPVPESFLLQGKAQGLGILGGEEEAEMDDHTGVSIPTGKQRIKGGLGFMISTRDEFLC